MKTAIIVIDMQNEYCHNDGALGKEGIQLKNIQTMIPHMKSFLEKARSKNVPVIFTQMTEDPAHMPENIKKIQAKSFGSDWKMSTPGTWGYELIIQPATGERVFAKNTYDMFSNKELKAHLDKLGVTRLIIMGVNAHVCVSSSVRSAITHGYNVVLPTDLVQSPDNLQAAREGTLAVLALLFARGTISKELVEQLEDESRIQ